MANLTTLHAILAVVVLWIALGVAGLFVPRNLRLVAKFLFPLGAAGALVLAAAGFFAVMGDIQSTLLPVGLPNLPFHLRVDPLSGFFLMLLGAVAAGVSVYTAGYLRANETSSPGQQCFFQHTFLASMALVMIANDAYGFLVFWEAMALSSYFLVVSDHDKPEIRRAGFLYLLMAHVGAIAILLCFGVLQGGVYTFDAMRETNHTPFWATTAFLLALIGFGGKAGLVPLHVWLPEAHPAAPSPASALLSAVMLKAAVYGFVRVIFDLLGQPLWWWGVLVLALGLFSALYGVLFAAVQSDMKRLLAWSSVENIGFIFAGLGLAMTFHAYDMRALAALALTAALYHALNHGFFKSLLFLATGSVMHATGERSLGKLGGLMQRMPWVAWLALVGALAIAGVPPLNGFVSEWMLLQAFLFTPSLPQGYLNMLLPVATALVVLAAALAGYVMVKFYGVVFLGQAREEKFKTAHDASLWERFGLAWLAMGCVFLGLAPVFVIGLIDHIAIQLLGQSLGNTSNWLFLAPINAERSSYSPLLFLTIIALVTLATWLIVRRIYHARIRRGPAWDCGFPAQTPRMQDTAEGFGQPVRVVFELFFRMQRELPSPSDRAPRYRVKVDDHLWFWLYLPLQRGTELVSNFVSRLQQGRISLYLAYSFVTLIALLLFIP
ncbi:MAG: hydrogenase 4 subunit B [Burkholderiales bacterium]